MTNTAPSRQTVFTGAPNPQAPGSPVFRHIVMITMRSGTAPHEVDLALRLMDAMCDQPMVYRYQVALSEDVRKGFVLSEWVDFADKAGLEAFKATEAHGKFVEFIRERGDWFISDYYTVA